MILASTLHCLYKYEGLLLSHVSPPLQGSGGASQPGWTYNPSSFCSRSAERLLPLGLTHSCSPPQGSSGEASNQLPEPLQLAAASQPRSGSPNPSSPPARDTHRGRSCPYLVFWSLPKAREQRLKVSKRNISCNRGKKLESAAPQGILYVNCTLTCLREEPVVSMT